MFISKIEILWTFLFSVSGEERGRAVTEAVKGYE